MSNTEYGEPTGSGRPGDPVQGEAVRVYEWQWGRDEDRRPGLPWVGVFLVVVVGLLLAQQMLPDYQNLGNVVLLGAGLASLVVWILRRGTIPLYFGAFLTAAAMPGVIEGLTATDLGPGWGTLFFGIALLFVAAVRAASRGGFGWQAIAGAALVLLASTEIAVPSVCNLVFPALLLALGVVLLIRGGRPG